MSELTAHSGAARYVDTATGETFDLAVPRWRSNSGAPLSISELPGIGRSGIDSSVRSLWRYAGSFPLNVEHAITLGEGCTPLVDMSYQDHRALFKLEWVSPTGSFKDRGASFMISALRQQGIRSILEDSSGNGGSAIAAYCAAAGMFAKILVPASTQKSKIVQIRAYGAEVELVQGGRRETAREAFKQAEQFFYASHNWHPFFLHGTKTLAYELWEDLGYSAPDNIIIPTGAGSNVLGCDLGFSELIRRKEIDRFPRLFAVQPENCAPIDASFRAGSDRLLANIPVKPTIAEGTAISEPVRIREVLKAIRRSRGGTVAISESEIVVAMRALAKLGLYVEPSSASAAAALSQLLSQGVIFSSEKTVVVLTGRGTKATQSWADHV